ncbi:MAG: caspase family protein [Pseudomonadota bacterium]
MTRATPVPYLCVFLLNALLLCWPVASEAGSRRALVIGNQSYPERPLDNPIKDAELVSGLLRKAGFTITKRTNLTNPQMRRIIDDWADNEVASGDVALVYYAGHGFEVDGRNYFIGTDSKISSDSDIKATTYPVDELKRKLDKSGARMKILILDACREDPYKTRGWSDKALARGFQVVELTGTSGWYIAYSTQTGTQALDGLGQENGPFAAALGQYMLASGVDIDIVFRNVRRAVEKITGGRQIPTTDNSLTGGEFFFLSGGERAGTVSVTAQSEATREISDMLFAWLEAWSEEDLDAFGSYLAPNYHMTNLWPKDNERSERDKQTRVDLVRDIWSRQSRIRIYAEDVKIKALSSTKGVISYTQKYRSSKYNSDGDTTLTVRKGNQGWHIIDETFVGRTNWRH